MRDVAATLAAAGSGMLLSGCSPRSETVTHIEVPDGFEPRIVARSGYVPTTRTRHRWHPAPDGGGCFDAGNGGWIYVSNREDYHEGGASALRFDANGNLVDAYPVLTGTSHNCAGGVSPWGSWLSCEELDHGLVWECDPFGEMPGRPLPVFGICKHESAAVDPLTGHIYLTEDKTDGGLYRFTPESWIPGVRPDLSRGLLDVACQRSDRVDWQPVPDPLAKHTPMRHQVKDSAIFRGGEGVSIADRMLRFTTKRDNRIWELNLLDYGLSIFDQLPGPAQRVDNLKHTPAGEVILAEESRNMQILYYPLNQGPPVTLVRIHGHGDSEITGLAFDPGGTRLYFSSQRGSTGRNRDGLTFELMGDFNRLTRDIEMASWRLDHSLLPR